MPLRILPILHTKLLACGTSAQFRCHSSPFEQPRQDHHYVAKIPQSCTSTHNPETPPQTQHLFNCHCHAESIIDKPRSDLPLNSPASFCNAGTSYKVLSLTPHPTLQNSTLLPLPSGNFISSRLFAKHHFSVIVYGAYSPLNISRCLHKSPPKVCMSIAIRTLPDLMM